MTTFYDTKWRHKVMIQNDESKCWNKLMAHWWQQAITKSGDKLLTQRYDTKWWHKVMKQINDTNWWHKVMKKVKTYRDDKNEDTT